MMLLTFLQQIFSDFHDIKCFLKKTPKIRWKIKKFNSLREFVKITSWLLLMFLVCLLCQL